MLKKTFQTSLLFAAFSGFNASAGILVDVELQLLTDVSGSIDAAEYNLQRQGYADAFRSNGVIEAILAGSSGSIAVQYIEFTSKADQENQHDWFLIDSFDSAFEFADLLENTSRAFGTGSRTGIAAAINYGADFFSTNDFDSNRQVIDISGDGADNEVVIAGRNDQGQDTFNVDFEGSRISVETARDAALAMGIDSINGITIGSIEQYEDGSKVDLPSYYENTVIGGEGSFHINALGFETFGAAIQQKLQREISGEVIVNEVPEPSSIALIGLALFGLFGANRKRA